MPVWNPTVANLTLMALGSSAPEILLSVIGTVSDIESIPSKLGPSTIVGSAAFNLLVISGASIIAVDETEKDTNGDVKYIPKKVYDTGVFAVTAIWSIFAYVWLYIVLKVSSDEIIETWEAWVTFIFFFILIAMAFGADRYKSYKEDQLKSEAERQEEIENNKRKRKSGELREIVKEYGQNTVIQIA